jgi:hypothetical protein
MHNGNPMSGEGRVFTWNSIETAGETLNSARQFRLERRPDQLSVAAKDTHNEHPT